MSKVQLLRITCGCPHDHANRRWGNQAKPCAKTEGCVHDDLKERKGWGFWIGAWNVDSLTERAGELVEALADKEVDVAHIQET